MQQRQFIGAELRQFENGRGVPEVAIVLHYDNGSASFSIVGYDVYKEQLAQRGDDPDKVLHVLLLVAAESQGKPNQPVFYSYDDVLPADGDKSAFITLDNMRNRYTVLSLYANGV